MYRTLLEIRLSQLQELHAFSLSYCHLKAFSHCLLPFIMCSGARKQSCVACFPHLLKLGRGGRHFFVLNPGSNCCFFLRLTVRIWNVLVTFAGLGCRSVLCLGEHSQWLPKSSVSPLISVAAWIPCPESRRINWLLFCSAFCLLWSVSLAIATLRGLHTVLALRLQDMRAVGCTTSQVGRRGHWLGSPAGTAPCGDLKYWLYVGLLVSPTACTRCICLSVGGFSSSKTTVIKPNLSV